MLFFKRTMAILTACLLMLSCAACAPDAAVKPTTVPSASPIASTAAGNTSPTLSAQPMQNQSPSGAPKPEIVFALEDESVHILSIAVSDAGELYYATTANEIRKIDADGNDLLVNDDHILYAELCWRNGRLFSLVAESGYTLLELDKNGNELKAHDLGDLGDHAFDYMMPWDDGKRIMLSRGNMMGMGVMGYLYDLESEELITLKNENEASCAGFYPIENGSMYMTRADFSGKSDTPLRVTLEGDRFALSPSDLGNAKLGDVLYDAQTLKYYTTTKPIPDAVTLALLDAKTGEQLVLSNLPGRSLYTRAFHGQHLYYTTGDEQHVIKRVDLNALESHATRSDTRVLTIAVGNEFTAAWDAPLQVFADAFAAKHPDVRVKFCFFPLDLEKQVDENQRISLAMISGEMNLDLIVYSMSYQRHLIESGLLKNLNEYGALRAILANPNLLSGVQNVCEKADGFFSGFPLDVAYPRNFYALNQALFEEHGIPMPALGNSMADVAALGERYGRASKSAGNPDVYFLRQRPITGAMFHFDPTSMLNADNGFTPAYDSQAFLDYMIASENPILYGHNLKMDNSEWPDWTEREKQPVLFEEFSVKMGNYIMTPSPYASPNSAKPPRWQMPYDRLEDFVFWAGKEEIPGIFTGFNLSESLMIGIAETAQNDDLAALFLAEFYDEAYQRANAKYALIYNDIKNHKHLARFPESFESATSYVYENYVQTYAIPRLQYWMNTELYPLYASGEITLEEVGQLLQKEALKRLKG